MGWSDLGVLMLGLCCAAPVVRGQGYVNIAPGKTYNQSSTHPIYLASYAADGSTATDPFFYSNSEYGLFWEVDLGRKYPVQNINVWGGGSINQDLTPFNITVDGQHCVRVNSTRGTKTSIRNISVTCSSLLYGQRVRLTRIYPSDSYLRLCEFEILACTPGLYGDNCTQACRPSKCLDNTCHPDTGLCMECGGNFNGSTCSECKAGYYRSGDSCYPCTSLCARYRCDPSNGSCIGCRPGFHGNKCEESCSDITNQCVQCTQSGQCTACSGHFQPPQCTACREGFYLKTEGVDHCTECTWKCHTSTPCNNMTGHCDMCHAGWEGPRCLQLGSTGHRRRIKTQKQLRHHPWIRSQHRTTCTPPLPLLPPPSPPRPVTSHCTKSVTLATRTKNYASTPTWCLTERPTRNLNHVVLTSPRRCRRQSMCTSA